MFLFPKSVIRPLSEFPKCLDAARGIRQALEEKLAGQAAPGYNIVADAEVRARVRAALYLMSKTEEVNAAALPHLSRIREEFQIYDQVPTTG